MTFDQKVVGNVSPAFVSPTYSLKGGFMPTKLSVKDVIHPVELQYQRSISQMVLDWTEELVRYLQDDYDSESYDKGGIYKFTIQTGRKYHKIHDGQGVHAFVDKNTGQVYKPASYKAPAKHVRYDLRSIKQRHACFSNADWSGSYLYIK